MQKGFSESWDVLLTNTINIVRKLSEGEHYNFWLNECCYECVTVQLLFLLFCYTYQFFNNLILVDIIIIKIGFSFYLSTHIILWGATCICF